MTSRTDLIPIPKGIKLPYRPPVEVGDEILILQDDPTSTTLLAGLGWRVVDRVEGTGSPVVLFEGDRFYIDDPLDSWAIVNGPVEKGDWVIVLEGNDSQGTLTRIEQVYGETSDGRPWHVVYAGGPQYKDVYKWARVELEDKPVIERSFTESELKKKLDKKALIALGLAEKAKPTMKVFGTWTATNGDEWVEVKPNVWFLGSGWPDGFYGTFDELVAHLSGDWEDAA